MYNRKGGLYIGKAVLKNNVFVLDFVPDQGTADTDAIVNFTTCSHPPNLDPDFGPGGFWYSHTIPEAERKGVSSDSTENSSRDNSISNNIGSSSSSNIGRSRSNNNSTNTNHQLFISTKSRHQYHTDSRLPLHETSIEVLTSLQVSTPTPTCTDCYSHNRLECA
ncbi:unnamed protein product [Closterium sp. NIES-54]